MDVRAVVSARGGARASTQFPLPTFNLLPPFFHSTPSGHNARIFDVAPAPAASTAFAGWLASASEDDAVRLWRPREAGGGGGGTDTDFDLAAAFRGHSDPVLRVAWHVSSPDSGLLASSSGDRTARLWRVEERGGGRWATAPVATLGGHAEEVYACEFLGDRKSTV